MSRGNSHVFGLSVSEKLQILTVLIFLSKFVKYKLRFSGFLLILLKDQLDVTPKTRIKMNRSCSSALGSESYTQKNHL